MGKEKLRIFYPFLSIRVFQVVDRFGIPHSANAKKVVWQKTILCHDNKYDKETTETLEYARVPKGDFQQSRTKRSDLELKFNQQV